MRMRVGIVGVGLLVAAGGISANRLETAKPYTLVYKMEKGTTLAVQVERTHSNYRNFMGNELTTNSQELVEYEFTVKSSGNRGTQLELQYTKRENQVDEGQAQSADFSTLIGRKVTALLSPTGVLSDFKGFENLPEIDIPGRDDPLGKLQYINEAVSLFPRLSVTPVAPGDSWSGSVKYDERIGDVTLPLTVDYTYTLIEETTFKGYDCLKIEGESTIRLSGPLMAGGLDLHLDLTGTGTDTVYFAWKMGMFLSSDSHAIIEGSADNEDMGVSIPMVHDIESNTTVSFD